ncbi:MAG: carbonic anhydrase [Cyanobacteria bacterium SZAS LIN-5]|nr:carbonic anhydrase [Cyanobacteria bacterium SZAS LIN-5]RTL44653.1 MAG: carbonic anhydrase [Candidatus Melainabacteria bacterium]
MKKQSYLLSILVFSSLYCPLEAQCKVTPDAAIKALQNGNARYVSGKSKHPRIDPERRRATALEGQTPISAILGCADSRVPPEIIFDQGFADLFVVRVAGNVCAVPELASIEYAVAVLKVPSIVVLGHTKCGAVDAAIKNGALPGSLPELVKMIRPAVESSEGDKKSKSDLLTRATEQNVRNTIAELTKSSVIKSAIDSKELKVVGAIRHLEDGHVTWLK